MQSVLAHAPSISTILVCDILGLASANDALQQEHEEHRDRQFAMPTTRICHKAIRQARQVGAQFAQHI